MVKGENPANLPVQNPTKFHTRPPSGSGVEVWYSPGPPTRQVRDITHSHFFFGVAGAMLGMKWES